MIKYLKIDVTLLLLFVIGFLILSANFFFVIYYKNNRLELHRSYINSLNNEGEITLGVYADMADLIYRLYIDTPKVKGIFAQGVKSKDLAEKDRYRKLLYNELSDLYQILAQYDFRQLHFHENNNRSYLRFHRPEKFGDDLTGIRYSVEYANSKKQYIRGFEEGKIFNGYRFVYPVFFNGEHIGSVEVSVSMNTIIQQLREMFNKKVQFIILKSQVMKKVFESERQNYVAWCVDDNYAIDRTISATCILKGRIIGEDAAEIKKVLAENSEKGCPFIIEIDVGSVPAVLTFMPIKNFIGENVAYIFAISDSKKITDLDHNFYFVFAAMITLFVLLVIFGGYYRFSQNKIERMATFDSLTNIYNRGALTQVIKIEYERYKRYKRPFSLIMIDIDHFKNINDTYGHNAGDTVLSGIALIMKNSIRKSDLVGRYGGEEFIVLLSETREENAAAVAEKLRQEISEHVFHNIGIVTVSCGVVEISEQTKSIDEVINAADKKLYTAKHQGRNRVVV